MTGSRLIKPAGRLERQTARAATLVSPRRGALDQGRAGAVFDPPRERVLPCRSDSMALTGKLGVVPGRRLAAGLAKPSARRLAERRRLGYAGRLTATLVGPTEG